MDNGDRKRIKDLGGVEVVTASDSDPTVQALIREGLRVERDLFPGRDDFYDRLQARREQEGREPEPSLKDGATLLAVADKVALGVVRVRRHQGALTRRIDRQPEELTELNRLAQESRVAAISALYVRSDARGLMVALRLAHEAIALAEGMGCSAAVFRTGKLPKEGARLLQMAARELFRKVGFHQLDGPPVILNPGVDDDKADGMVRWLTEVPGVQEGLEERPR